MDFAIYTDSVIYLCAKWQLPNDLDLIPLRVHREDTIRGYLLLIFITLTVFTLIKKEIDSDYTVEEALLTMRNLKCKVYDNA